MDLSQNPGSASLLSATDPASSAEETVVTPPIRRKPLQFEPEPTQRMVVVRRRSRRRRRKEDKSEKMEGRIRIVLFTLVVALLLVAVSGQRFAMALMDQLRTLLRPLKSHLHAPRLEVVALILAALILLYMMPGVEGTVRRWLGINRKSDKPR